MQRPGPLQELPLERFLPTYPNFPSKSVRSQKRPLSPGSPNPYSPTKRRILNSEGIFSPEKTCKTPMSFAKASPARFSDVLAGSASPAKILDFGLPKNHGGETAKCSSEHNFTQIPSLSLRKTSSPTPESRYRSVRRVSPAHHLSSGVPADAEASGTSSTRPGAVPIDIPRELPPPPDPQSIHYPGFVVFQDTHITIYPANFNSERVSNVDTNMDSSKENLPPHRKTLHKATFDKPKLEATTPGKLKSATRTTNKVAGIHGPSFSTRAGPGSDLSPSCSPMKIDGRQKLRRMIEEDDLEEGQNGDDDE